MINTALPGMNSESLGRLVDAAATGSLDILQRLITSEPQPPDEKTIQTLLAAAAWKSQISTVEFLLGKYPPGSIEEEPVRAVVNSRSIPLFSTLLSKYPWIINMQFDKRGTPLIVACLSQQSFDFLNFLLEAGADPNLVPDFLPTPLAFVGAFYHNTQVVDLLLKHGAKIEQSGALPAAASCGNETMVRYLLECGADQDRDRTLDSTTDLAIHAAAGRGRVEVLKILLDHGAHANAKNGSEKTALEVAEEREEKEGTDLSEVKELLRRSVS
ncbi:Fc.00g025760.m01.CDS01 [Cosmosporella sp. VM-42]